MDENRKKPIETVEDDCYHPDCVFRGTVSIIGYGMTPCCDYILLTGRPRPCSIKNCTAYRNAIKERRRVNGHIYYYVPE